MTGTANGYTLTDAVITMPRTGAWTADITVAEPDADLSGRVVLDVAGGLFSGTTRRSQSFSGRTAARVVGGADGLRARLLASGYTSTTAGLIFEGILSAVGETAAASISASVLATSLPRWTRLAGSASEALDRLAAKVGASWRVLADGSIWIGAESWPAAVAADVLSEDRENGRLLLAPTSAVLRPGQVLDGRRIGRVVHRWTPRGLRTEAYVDRHDEALTDRVRGALEAVAERQSARRRYHATYPGRVASQSGNAVDVVPEDPTLPELSDVPLRLGLPGVKAESLDGQRVRVAFDNGDPAAPYAATWDAGGTLKLGTLLVITNTTIGAVVAVQWFEGGATGTAAAAAALAALSPPIVGVLVPITAGAVSL